MNQLPERAPAEFVGRRQLAHAPRVPDPNFASGTLASGYRNCERDLREVIEAVGLALDDYVTAMRHDLLDEQQGQR